MALMVQPLLMIGIALLYYNARIKKDGFDLEMLAMEVMGDSYDASSWDNLPDGETTALDHLPDGQDAVNSDTSEHKDGSDLPPEDLPPCDPERTGDL